MLKGVLWGMASTLFSDESFKLLDSGLLTLDAGFRLQSDSIIGIKLLLKLDNCLIALIES